jgi:hypothetical protein
MTAPRGPLVSSVRDIGVQFMDNPMNITGHDCARSYIDSSVYAPHLLEITLDRAGVG